MACLLRQLHALIDRRVSGNAIQKPQLKRAQTEGDEDFRIELRIWPLEQRTNLRVQPDLPAKHAHHQGSGQIAVGWAECIHIFVAEQIVGVSFATLNSQQNVEGDFARGRDGGHGNQSRRASAASGLPRRNSAALRRFLPSSCTSLSSSQVLPAQVANKR